LRRSGLLQPDVRPAPGPLPVPRARPARHSARTRLVSARGDGPRLPLARGLPGRAPGRGARLVVRRVARRRPRDGALVGQCADAGGAHRGLLGARAAAPMAHPTARGAGLPDRPGTGPARLRGPGTLRGAGLSSPL
ncbi:MAG: hypothetical protein AVDCRST_MAG88-171, partial [uncultured Thermomicrobiales bacterium]